MPQPLAVGSILGGRYRITDHVVTSADQDMVFHGADQVLNRQVTVLVASPENATQVAASARELATGERTDDVQVLDLGLSEGRTYLIAGGDPDPDVLLGLAYAQELYVEPFQTDTLGSEIFGESRTDEAHQYDDDAAYYADLDRRLRADEAQAKRRPGLFNRLSERISERVRPADGTAAKAAAGASALAAAEAATKAQIAERERLEREAREAEEQAQREAEEKAARERAEQERLEQERLEQEAREREQREAREKAEREGEARRQKQRETREAEEKAAREKAGGERAEQERAAQAGAARDRTAQERPTEEPSPAPSTGTGRPTDATDATQAVPTVTPAAPQRRPRPAPRRALGTVASGSGSTAMGQPGSSGLGISARAEKFGRTPSTAPAPAPRTGAAGAAGVAGAAGAAAVAGAATSVAGTAGSPAAGRSDAAETVDPRQGGAGAASSSVEPPADRPDAGHPAPAAEPSRSTSPKGWLLVLGLIALLALAGLAGLWLLGQNARDVEQGQAGASSAPTSSTTAEPSASQPVAPTSGSASASDPAAAPAPVASSSSSSAVAAAPQPVGVLRDVPEMPDLESANDATLPNLIDGDPTTAWRSYTYNRPNFGGYVGSMNLIVELKDEATVNEVTLSDPGATGGNWIAYIADTAQGGQGDAREIGQGTFDQDQISIPVDVADKQAKYVILSITSLPQVQGGGQRPFGLNLTEIGVR